MPRPPTKAQAITSALAARIVEGELDPGAWLPSERELAREFGADRSTVRRALRMLAAHGLVRVEHGSGVQVRTAGRIRRAASDVTRQDSGASNAGPPAVRRISSRVVYENPWMVVREDGVERLDGSRGIYGVIDKPDFVLVVPEENGGFHLVEEFRYPIGRRTWSFPQGAAPGRREADPEELARRELAEETGFTAGRLRRIGYLNCSHGTSGQGFTVFHATDLTPGEPDREAEEQDMRQRWVPRAEFREYVAGGLITDDSTLAAFALLMLDGPAHGEP